MGSSLSAMSTWGFPIGSRARKWSSGRLPATYRTLTRQGADDADAGDRRATLFVFVCYFFLLLDFRPIFPCLDFTCLHRSTMEARMPTSSVKLVEVPWVWLMEWAAGKKLALIQQVCLWKCSENEGWALRLLLAGPA